VVEELMPLLKNIIMEMDNSNEFLISIGEQIAALKAIVGIDNQSKLLEPLSILAENSQETVRDAAANALILFA